MSTFGTYDDIIPMHSSLDDFQDELLDYQRGEREINIHAATMTLTTLNRVIERVVDTINNIAVDVSAVELINIKQLVADMHCVDNFEIQFFRAFEAPLDRIFFQAKDSERWQHINKHIQYVEIGE